MVLRVGRLVGFVTTVGLGGQVSHNDTPVFARAQLVRMRSR
jgi:hypothetical protein